MTSRNPHSKRVLSIDPTSRGFGFVVFESPTTLADWGTKSIRHQDEAKTVEKILKLIRHYQPKIMVLEDHSGSRRCARVRRLLDAVCRMVTAEGLKCRRVQVSRVKQVFRTFRAKTKHEIAHAVAQQLPELAAELPRYRKAWMSEGSQMAIFDAAALALTYFFSRPVGNRDLTQQWPVEPKALSGSTTP